MRDTLPNGAERVRFGALPEAPEPAPVDLRLGELEGDSPDVFGDVRAIEVGADGTIYVLDAQASEVRAFDPDGAFRSVVARSGEGPGEISQANGLERAPDGSLWVQDHARWQLLRLDPEGGEIERTPMFVRQYGYTWNAVVREDGWVWTEQSESDVSPGGPPEPGLQEGETTRFLVGLDPETGEEASVRIGTLASRSFVVTLENGWSVRRIPYQEALLAVPGANGDIWTARTGSYRIARLDSSGDTVLVIEAEVPPAPVTGEDRRALVEAAVEAGQPGGEQVARQIAEVLPDMKPVLEQLVVDDEGRLWVRRAADADDAAVRFDVFGREGDYLGPVRIDERIPSWFAPRIRGGRLHTLVLDSLDVPYVVRVPVEPSWEARS